MEYPRVSVLIPTYNQSKYIKATVESALMQDYANLEIFVVDDCSTDDTKVRLRTLLDSSAITYVKNSKNIGRVGNYRKALYEHATGDWILNLDGDDFLTDPNFVRDAMQAVARHSNEKIVFIQAGHDILWAGQEKGIRCVPNIPQDELLMNGVDYFLNFDRIDHFSHLSTLYRRDVALQLEFYRLDILSTDMESFVRMALHGDIILLRKSVGVWRHHQSNAFNELDHKAHVKNLEWVASCYNYALERRSERMDSKTLRKWRQKQVAVSLSKYLGLEALLSRKDKRHYIVEFLRYVAGYEAHAFKNPLFLMKLFLACFGNLKFYRFVARIGRRRFMNAKG